MFAIDNGEEGGRKEDVEKGNMEALLPEKELVYSGPELPWAFYWVSQT